MAAAPTATTATNHRFAPQGNNAFAANNALQLLAGGGRNGMHLAGPGGVAPAGDDGGASANMLQQLQLAQIIKQAAGEAGSGWRRLRMEWGNDSHS